MTAQGVRGPRGQEGLDLLPQPIGDTPAIVAIDESHGSSSDWWSNGRPIRVFDGWFEIPTGIGPKGRDVLIEAVGAAIAPMRGVIRSIMKRRGDFGEVTAVFGVRVPEDFPFRNEMDDWKQARIETLLTVS
jgi:hypothetical protein